MSLFHFLKEIFHFLTWELNNRLATQKLFECLFQHTRYISVATHTQSQFRKMIKCDVFIDSHEVVSDFGHLGAVWSLDPQTEHLYFRFLRPAPAKSTFARVCVSGRPAINKLLGARKGVDALDWTTSTEWLLGSFILQFISFSIRSFPISFILRFTDL